MQDCNVRQQGAAIIAAFALFVGKTSEVQDGVVHISLSQENAKSGGAETTTSTSINWLTNFRKRHRGQGATLISVTPAPVVPSPSSGTSAGKNTAPFGPRLTILVEQDAHIEDVWLDRWPDTQKNRRYYQAGIDYDDVPTYAYHDPTNPPLRSLRHLTVPAQGEIWTADLDGTHDRRLVARSSFTYRTIQWSLDGQWLLYQGREGNGYAATKPKPMQTWIVDAKGKRSREIAEGDDAMPQWSADSASILFWRNKTSSIPGVKKAGSAPVTYEPARWYLYRAAAPWNKTNVSRASNVALDGPVSLSQDGSRFICKVWQRSGGQYLQGPLAFVNVITGTITALDASRRQFAAPGSGEPPFEAFDYHWSPDGKSASLNSNSNGGNGLNIITVESGAQNGQSRTPESNFMEPLGAIPR